MKATKHLAHCCLVAMKETDAKKKKKETDALLSDIWEQKIKAQKIKELGSTAFPSKNSLKSIHLRMK